MAHTKTGASIKGSRKPIAKRLGVKKYAGEKVISGNIIIRQRGTKYHPGIGTLMGKDYTIFAKGDGIVNFYKKRDNVYVGVK